VLHFNDFQTLSFACEPWLPGSVATHAVHPNSNLLAVAAGDATRVVDCQSRNAEGGDERLTFIEIVEWAVASRREFEGRPIADARLSEAVRPRTLQDSELERKLEVIEFMDEYLAHSL
jgi:hypothetical protein